MNNLSWSKNSTTKSEATIKEEKPKKKPAYKKEMEDLAKIKIKLEEKYEQFAINKVSNAIIEIESAIQNLKKVEYYDL